VHDFAIFFLQNAYLHAYLYAYLNGVLNGPRCMHTLRRCGLDSSRSVVCVSVCRSNVVCWLIQRCMGRICPPTHSVWRQTSNGRYSVCRRLSSVTLPAGR